MIRNCIISDSGNGLFVAASDGATRDIRIEKNWIVGNGNDGSIYEHNTYTAAIGIVYDDNRFGPLRAGAGGNNLKDRSAGLVVRYNWIESGNRQLDLVDAEDSDVIVERSELRRDLRLRQRADRARRRGQSPDRPLRRRQRRRGDLPQGHPALLPQHGHLDARRAAPRSCGSRPTTSPPTSATT